MAYADAKSPQSRATAIAGVVAVHAGIGAILIYGLASGEFEKLVDPPITGGQIPIEPPPPPDPIEEPPVETPPTAREVVAPKPIIDIAPNPPRVDNTDIILPPTPPAPRPVPNPVPTLAPPPPPAPTPSFDPLPARPSNNQAGWVTQNDYKSSWIARDYTGTVGYRLSVGAGGKVDGCSITRSSGVGALDEATCQLITRRARFNPAKDSQGRATGGSYSGAVRWELPN